MSKKKDKTELGSVFGDTVSIQKVNNRLTVKSRPKRTGKKGKLSEKAIAQHERFRQASRYASSVHNDEELNKLYSAGKRGKHESAYTVALADFQNPPKIGSIDVNKRKSAGKDEIQIIATDDFMVVQVSVEIFTADDTFIEQGEASENSKRKVNGWFYTPTVAQPLQPGMKIVAAAYDRPGNKTEREVVL
ncbi:MAG: hypothetical protein HOP08_15760 [Cyclobacteriaceae bacterium]|nr:hypothetical protein [Cyclobacteriaceae bacterium]